MQDLREYIKGKFDFSDKEVSEMVCLFKQTRLKKNQYFLKEGSRCRQIAFINSGVMRNYSIDINGNEITNYMTSDGDFNTVYQYFLSQESCPENIQAVTNCEISVIQYDDFHALKESSSSFRHMVDQLISEGLKCKDERLRAYHTKDAQKRYENLMVSQPKIVRYSPMQHIASYLGITRETLSRIRNHKMLSS